MERKSSMTTITKCANDHLNVSDGRPFSLKDSLYQIQKVIVAPSFLKVGQPWFFLSILTHILHSFFLMFLERNTPAHSMITIVITGVDFMISAGVSVAWYRFLAFQKTTQTLSFGKEEQRFLCGYLLIGAMIAFFALLMISLLGPLLSTATHSLILRIFPFVIASLSFFFLTPIVHLFLGCLGIGIPIRSSLSYAIRIFRPIFMILSTGYCIISLFLGGFSIGLFTLLTISTTTTSQALISFISLLTSFLSISMFTIFTSHVLYKRCLYRLEDDEKSFL